MKMICEAILLFLQEPLIFFLFQFWFLLGGLALFLIYSRALQVCTDLEKHGFAPTPYQSFSRLFPPMQKLISSLLDSFFDTLRGVRGGGKRSEKTKCD